LGVKQILLVFIPTKFAENVTDICVDLTFKKVI
jgi:hypothetical protein